MRSVIDVAARNMGVLEFVFFHFIVTWCLVCFQASGSPKDCFTLAFHLILHQF